MSPSTMDKVGKFDGSNYQLWAYKMRMFLTAKGLWGYVDGSAPKDTEKAGQAHANVVLRLEDSQLVHVMKCKTAKDVWQALEAMNQQKDMSTKMWLKQKYATFRFNSDCLAKHLEELEKLLLEMQSADCMPEEEDICATLLRSLPSQYDMLVQAVRMSMQNVAYSALVMKIKSEEIRLRDQEERQEQTAMFAKKKHYGAKKDKKDKKQVKCFGCGKMGHFKSECRAKKSPNEDKSESHVAFNANVKRSSEDRAMWVVDSGASNHMCNDRTLFEDFKVPTTDKYVSVAKAGTKLKILGIGVVKISLQVDDKVIQAKLQDTLLVEDLARNLFSVSAVTKRGMSVEIGGRGCKIYHQGKVVATGSQIGSLVYLNVSCKRTAY